MEIEINFISNKQTCLFLYYLFYNNNNNFLFALYT